jgi:hypothetical protein
MALTEELRARLKTKQHEWEKCKEELRRAKDKDAALREEIGAIQVVLAKMEPAKKQESQAPIPVSIDGGSEKNKAEAVRLVIEDMAGNEGLAPSQIRTFLEVRKVQMPTNYLYAILTRAKKAGKVTEKSGRYFPAEKANVAS